MNFWLMLIFIWYVHYILGCAVSYIFVPSAECVGDGEQLDKFMLLMQRSNSGEINLNSIEKAELNNKIEDREVTIGSVSSLGQLEIISGLSPGDKVILNPQIK